MGVLCNLFVGVLCDQFHDEFVAGLNLSDIFLQISNDFRSLQENGRVEMVGVERFESLPHIESNFKIIFCKFNHF